MTGFSFVLALGLVLFALVWWLTRSEIYGTFHLALNGPGKRGSRPPTEWMNMGYWKDTTRFPEACEALALKTIQAAHCIPGGHVLDVGHGSGDSLLLHLTHDDIPRPSSLSGITNVKAQHLSALHRTSSEIAANHLDVSLDLQVGDAVFRSSAQLEHPLNPTSSSPKLTSIVAVDCAYHFKSRELFLRQCFDRLQPRGHIGFADLCFLPPKDSTWFSYVTARVICMVLGVPWTNMLSPQDYVEQLERLGYVEVSVEDITGFVFPRFIAFLKGERMPGSNNQSQYLGAGWWLTGLVFNIWWKTCGGTYVLVSAKKP